MKKPKITLRLLTLLQLPTAVSVSLTVPISSTASLSSSEMFLLSIFMSTQSCASVLISSKYWCKTIHWNKHTFFPSTIWAICTSDDRHGTCRPSPRCYAGSVHHTFQAPWYAALWHYLTLVKQ